jgi:hypothetical protein
MEPVIVIGNYQPASLSVYRIRCDLLAIFSRHSLRTEGRIMVVSKYTRAIATPETAEFHRDTLYERKPPDVVLGLWSNRWPVELESLDSCTRYVLNTGDVALIRNARVSHRTPPQAVGLERTFARAWDIQGADGLFREMSR